MQFVVAELQSRLLRHLAEIFDRHFAHMSFPDRRSPNELSFGHQHVADFNDALGVHVKELFDNAINLGAA